MKRISCIFILLIFLNSCSNLSAPKVTVTPQSTFSPTPSLTPTITPTITLTPTVTLTPTETPDPNKPVDATGKDPATGEFTKSVEENGKAVIYIWKQFQFGDDAKNGITGHWFKSRMENGPINMLQYEETCEEMWGGPYTLNMNVYAVEGLDDLNWLGNIYQPDRRAEFDKYKDLTEGGRGIGCTTIPLPSNVMHDLFFRYIKLLPSESPRDGEYVYQQPDMQAFAEAMGKGEMSIEIGEELWFPTKGYDVYWIPESMAINDPSMEVLRDSYRKVMVDDGKLIAIIAVTKFRRNDLVYGKSIYRELTFNQLILNPLEFAITNTFPAKNSTYYTPYNYWGKTGIPSGSIYDKYFYINFPFIDFTPIQ